MRQKASNTLFLSRAPPPLTYVAIDLTHVIKPMPSHSFFAYCNQKLDKKLRIWGMKKRSMVLLKWLRMAITANVMPAK